MTEIIGYILAGCILLGIAVGLNKSTNERAQAKCLEQGGEFYRAVEAGKSLCKLPQKNG